LVRATSRGSAGVAADPKSRLGGPPRAIAGILAAALLGESCNCPWPTVLGVSCCNNIVEHLEAGTRHICVRY